MDPFREGPFGRAWDPPSSKCLVTVRRLVGSPELVLLASPGTFVAVTPDSVIIGGRIRNLPSTVVKACIAGQLIALLLRTGELHLIDKTGATVVGRAVAVPAEIGDQVILTADKAGNYIGIGLSNDFIVYRKHCEDGQLSLKVKTTLRFALRTQLVQLFAHRDECLIWSYVRQPQPLVRLEGPAGEDAHAYPLSSSREVLAVVSFNTLDGGSLLVYKDGLNYISNERIRNGQSLPFYPLPGVTCSTGGDSEAYVVAKGELFRVKVRDGHFDIETICLLESVAAGSSKLTLFTVRKEMGNYVVHWAGAGRRGRFTVDAQQDRQTMDIQSHEGIDYASKDFEVLSSAEGTSLLAMSAAPSPPKMMLIKRAVPSNLVSDFTPIAAAPVTDLFWAAGHLFVVGSSSTMVYTFRNSQCRFVRKLPQCFAVGIHDDVIITAQPEGIIAYTTALEEYHRHSMRVGSGHIAHGQVAVNGDGVWVGHGWNPPRQVLEIDPSVRGEWINFTKIIDQDTMMVGTSNGLKFYNTHTGELLREEPHVVTDYIQAPWGPVMATRGGIVTSNGQRHVLGSIPLYFAGIIGDYVVAHGQGLWLVGREEARSIALPGKYSPLATHAVLWATVGVFDDPGTVLVAFKESMISVRPHTGVPDALSTLALSPHIDDKPLAREPTAMLQLPTHRAIIVAAGRHFEAFDLKDNARLDVDSDVPKAAITALGVWNIEVGDQRYEYLAAGTVEGDKHFIRLLDVRRKRTKVTVRKRIKVAVAGPVIRIVESGDLFYAVGTTVTALALQLSEEGRSLKIEVGASATYPAVVADIDAGTDEIFVATQMGVYVTAKEGMRVLNALDELENRMRHCACIKRVMLGPHPLILVGDQTRYISVLKHLNGKLEQVTQVPVLSPARRLRFCHAHEHAVAAVALLQNGSFVECALANDEGYGISEIA